MKIGNLLSTEEFKYFNQASDFKGFQAIFCTWAIITFSFVLVAYDPNIFTIALALILLGGRHLALAILCHDASHYSLFKTKKLNDILGQWLCAYPTWMDVNRYRKHHLKHHRFTGGEKDPDMALVTPYPTSKKSMIRKFARDLIGITGIKRMIGLFLMDIEKITYSVSGTIEWRKEKRSFLSRVKLAIKHLHGVIITNSILFALLFYSGHPELYALWVISYLTTFSVFLRIRSIAEHACTKESLEMIENTRTTLANPIARLTVAPHRVNYHLEHHLLMTVPYFKLPELHKLLHKRGIYQEAFVSNNYVSVLKSAVKA